MKRGTRWTWRDELATVAGVVAAEVLLLAGSMAVVWAVAEPVVRAVGGK